MPYLEQIICLINDNFQLVFNDKAYGKNKIYGLTQPVQRTDKSDIIPAYLDNGQWRYVGMDDIDNLRIYHKLYTNTYDLVQNTSYGRNGGNEMCKSIIGLVVFGMRNKLNASQYELEKIVNQNLIRQITKVQLGTFNLKSVKIEGVSSDMDMASVFNREFKNIPYFLNEKHVLFELKYQIEAIYQKDCFTNC